MQSGGKPYWLDFLLTQVLENIEVRFLNLIQKVQKTKSFYFENFLNLIILLYRIESSMSLRVQTHGRFEFYLLKPTFYYIQKKVK